MGTVHAIPTWEVIRASIMKRSSLWQKCMSSLLNWRKLKYSMDVKVFVKKEIHLTKVLVNEVNSELVKTFKGTADEDHKALMNLRDTINTRLETIFSVFLENLFLVLS